MKPNIHHVGYERRAWESNIATKKIRTTHELMMPVDPIGHIALHEQITLVPLPDRFLAQRVLNNFTPIRGRYLKSLDELIRVFETQVKHHKATYLERQLGGLTIMALEMQRPILKEIIYINKYQKVA